MLAIVLVFLAAAAIKLEAAVISCKKIENLGLYGKCCFLHEMTVINEINVTIADLENSDVKGILFEHNKNVEFLPVNIYRNFPKLEMYSARNASVRELSALNFEMLTKLNYLDLRWNQIEFVPDYCFQGLGELSQIYLSMEDRLASACY